MTPDSWALVGGFLGGLAIVMLVVIVATGLYDLWRAR